MRGHPKTAACQHLHLDQIHVFIMIGGHERAALAGRECVEQDCRGYPDAHRCPVGCPRAGLAQQVEGGRGCPADRWNQRDRQDGQRNGQA